MNEMDWHKVEEGAVFSRVHINADRYRRDLVRHMMPSPTLSPNSGQIHHVDKVNNTDTICDEYIISRGSCEWDHNTHSAVLCADWLLTSDRLMLLWDWTVSCSALLRISRRLPLTPGQIKPSSESANLSWQLTHTHTHTHVYLSIQWPTSLLVRTDAPVCVFCEVLTLHRSTFEQQIWFLRRPLCCYIRQTWQDSQFQAQRVTELFFNEALTKVQ